MSQYIDFSFSFSMVIEWTTDIVMPDVRYARFFLARQWELFQPMPQDGLDASEARGTNRQGPGAGGLQPIFSKLVTKAKNPQAGSHSLLWVALLFQDHPGHLSGADTNLVCQFKHIVW